LQNFEKRKKNISKEKQENTMNTAVLSLVFVLLLLITTTVKAIELGEYYNPQPTPPPKE
jgi:hypothetical protein